MQARIGLMVGGLSAALIGCGGITDCKEDGAACAELLNKNADKCATAFTYKHSDKKRKRCENAIKVVGKGKVKAAVPGLMGILKVPESGIAADNHRQEAAKALGKIGDANAVDALIEAIDLNVGTSSDHKDKMGNRSNERIAQALGRLGDKKASAKLLQLLDRSRDNNAKLWAMRALGKLKDDSAIDALTKVALEHDNKFMRKNAIIAMGDIGSPKAIPSLIRMMFIEFAGVSFYPQASWALFQIGPAAVPALLETLALKNGAVSKDFEKSGGIKESAIIAKCAVVLGDLRDPQAIEPLIKAYESAIEKSDPILLGQMPFALGALSDTKAIPVLAKKMGTIDASIREPIMTAINKIGDRSVLKEMIATMTAKDFVERCVKSGVAKSACEGDVVSRARAAKATADAVTHLVDEAHLAQFKAAIDAEKVKDLQDYYKERYAAAKLAAECKTDAACWTKKTGDKSKLVREKAYWELGRLKDKAVAKTLAKGLKDKDSRVRAAAIFSYWNIGGKEIAEDLKKQLEEEKGRADFIRVNEDLKRLYIHLTR